MALASLFHRLHQDLVAIMEVEMITAAFDRSERVMRTQLTR